MNPEQRAEFVRNGITKEQKGIEIAPWFRPLAPKNKGYDCQILDVYSKQQLLERAINDSNIPPETHTLLEEVDFVGSATEIADLVPTIEHGTFDYIISSHNFEHLPNPIKFLQGCEKILKPKGRLIMVLPDQRACFDYFRPHTAIAEWIEAFLEDRKKPSRRQLFEQEAYFSEYWSETEKIYAFSLLHQHNKIVCTGNINKEYKQWIEAKETNQYSDAHCSVMTPSSFELLILESNLLGLTNFGTREISETHDCEFVVVLDDLRERRVDRIENQIERQRSILMHRILEEKAKSSAWGSYNQIGMMFHLKGLFSEGLKKIITIRKG